MTLASIGFDSDLTPDIDRTIRNVARSVSRMYGYRVDVDDLIQEGRFIVAMEPEYLDAPMNYVAFQLRRDLMNYCAKQTRYNDREFPLTEDAEAKADADVAYVPVSEVGSYNREMVDVLLPALWHESYCYGLPTREGAPDADMPRGSVNKAHGNNLPAYIADVKVGWAKAPLTLLERRALFLTIGCGWTALEVAEWEGVTRQAVNQRVTNGLNKIVNTLNGNE